MGIQENSGGGGEREAGEERAGGGKRVESRTNRGNYATMLHISQSTLDQTEKTTGKVSCL